MGGTERLSVADRYDEARAGWTHPCARMRPRSIGFVVTVGTGCAREEVAMPDAAVARSWTETMDRLRRYVTSRVSDPEVAADLAQDVVVRSLAAGALERADDLNGWLFRAAQNAIVDHYRTRRPTAGLADEVTSVAEPEVADAGPNRATRELARCMQPLIEQLPSKYRDALVAVDLEGRTHHEAAAAAAMSVSGMKSRVQRGRRQLRDLLAGCCTVAVDRTGSISSYTPADASCATAGCGCAG
jgi:RNA polymerase sigma-70 factor (ECF subfamily)